MLEIIVLGGTILGLIFIGVFSAVGNSVNQKRESKWAFPPAFPANEQGVGTFQPIEEASRYGVAGPAVSSSKEGPVNEPVAFEENLFSEPVYEEVQVSNPVTAVLNFNDFQHSVLPEQVNDNVDILMENFNVELEKMKFEGNVSNLKQSAKDKIVALVGETTARLVTNLITDLKENETSVLLGLYNQHENTIKYEDSILQLSTTKTIYSGEDDYILVKGTLLPNGIFRVIHTDDAETVELGYGIESFILPKTA